MSVTTGRRSKTGRTQEERSAAMRERLLDATIDCLVEYGYAGTTTTRVAERAGVTRGAQVHHFPTKADLVTAAVRHLASRRADLAFAEMDRLSTSNDPVGDTLDLLWEIHQGPIFAASMELLLAARTDPDLRAQVADVEPQISDLVLQFGRRLFGPSADTTQFRHYAYTAMDTVRGLLVSNWAYPDDTQLEARWQRAKACLRTMAPETLT
ncbi:TetR family transcriptional regulator [Actinocrispum wychmicini]|uniref:TetR family transcriptional regulator n=2 Tax=Actinocrispum wychmicini TaxID=1213861 RepID=A0A4R2K0I8_9PSEU|nr:TetR/AcrR family transcriptional regulator [Actinocrispum wychmicini]TCO65794.1 TetR family transcriptional regulator [Actinocrispum wychmicini]